MKRESDELANGDKADDKEVLEEWDVEDDVVEDSGFVHKWLQTGSDIRMGNGYSVTHYSDELANGDSADNKDIHEDEDMNDDVVDINGATNAGYGSRNMEYFHAHNNIDESVGPGHFLTM